RDPGDDARQRVVARGASVLAASVPRMGGGGEPRPIGRGGVPRVDRRDARLALVLLALPAPRRRPAAAYAPGLAVSRLARARGPREESGDPWEPSHGSGVGPLAAALEGMLDPRGAAAVEPPGHPGDPV